MKINELPHELLCKILGFLDYESYFNAIDSNIFPKDKNQYSLNIDIQQEEILENGILIEKREEQHRIQQGRILILSYIKEHVPQHHNYVEDNIQVWDDEINEYFLHGGNHEENNANEGLATKILNYAIN